MVAPPQGEIDYVLYVLKRVIFDVYCIHASVKRVQETIWVQEAIKSSYLDLLCIVAYEELIKRQISYVN